MSARLNSVTMSATSPITSTLPLLPCSRTTRWDGRRPTILNLTAEFNLGKTSCQETRRPLCLAGTP